MDEGTKNTSNDDSGGGRNDAEGGKAQTRASQRHPQTGKGEEGGGRERAPGSSAESADPEKGSEGRA